MTVCFASNVQSGCGTARISARTITGNNRSNIGFMVWGMDRIKELGSSSSHDLHLALGENQPIATGIAHAFFILRIYCGDQSVSCIGCRE